MASIVSIILIVLLFILLALRCVVPAVFVLIISLTSENAIRIAELLLVERPRGIDMRLILPAGLGHPLQGQGQWLTSQIGSIQNIASSASGN